MAAIDPQPAPGGYGAPTAPLGYPPPGYPAAAYMQPPPPVKKKRTGLIIGIVVGVVVLLCGGGAAAVGIVLAKTDKNASHDSAAVAPTSDATAGATSPTPTESTGPIHDGDLRRFLIPAPSGSDPVKHPLGAKNSFTAAQESKDWGNPSGRLATLSLHNFRTGAVRQWETADSLVEVELFRFMTPNSAKLFMGADQDGTDYFDQTATESTVKTVPESFLYYTKKKDKDQNTHAFAIANCGDVTIEVWVDTYGTVNTQYVGVLLRKQYVKLCP